MRTERAFYPEGGSFGCDPCDDATVTAILPLELLELAGDAFVVLAANAGIRALSEAAARLFGYGTNELREQPIELLLPDWPAEPTHNRIVHVEGRHRSGKRFPVGVAIGRLNAEDPAARVLILRALTDRDASERHAERLLTLIDESNDEIFVVIPEYWRFQMVNRRARENLGYDNAELDRLTLLDLNPGLDADRLSTLYEALRSQSTSEIAFPSIQQRRNGSTYEVDLRLRLLASDSTPLLAVLARDTTEKTRVETILQQQSLYDPITMLPNRTLFRDRLHRVLNGQADESRTGAVLLISIDTTTFIGEGLGHTGTDELAREIGSRLSNAVGVGDTVARLGDTEFAALIHTPDVDRDVGALTERILADLRRPIQLTGYQVVVPAAIGIASFPDTGRDPDTVLGNAAAALLGAREDTAVSYRVFTNTVDPHARTQVALNSGLSRALERHEFSLVYQPKVDIASWQVLGVEALLRWRNLDLGSVPPGVFVPVLERTGLISEVGNWVLETACHQRRLLKEAGFEQVRMAVNLSVHQVRRELLDTLSSTLARSGLAPGDLELEITESIIVNDGQAAVTLLREIAGTGILLSMDDFGCGYSSLSHLRQLPLHTIKIDRSFIADVATDADDAEIVKAIVSMGHALRHRVVAEGVETLQQLAALRRFGCDEIQGYLYSPPVPGDELMTLLINAGVVKE